MTKCKHNVLHSLCLKVISQSVNMRRHINLYRLPGNVSPHINRWVISENMPNIELFLSICFFQSLSAHPLSENSQKSNWSKKALTTGEDLVWWLCSKALFWLSVCFSFSIVSFDFKFKFLIYCVSLQKINC